LNGEHFARYGPKRRPGRVVTSGVGRWSRAAPPAGGGAAWLCC